jgi:aspartate/methionine/tyrosine aminotransferase
MRKFPAAPMSGLVDAPVRYDLAESTSPPLRLEEILGPDVLRRLKSLELGYGTTPGEAELRELIAADGGVAPDDVLVTVGGMSALFLLAFALCDLEEHMVLATPCFPPSLAVPQALNLRVTPVALTFDNGYRLDIDAIVAALTPATRLVSLASPQNPSGIRSSDEELLQLVRCIDDAAPEAVVLVDEAYRQTVYGSRQVPRSAAGLAPTIVTCSSLSKSHGAPGLRVGWLTTTQPALYERLRISKFNSLASCSRPDELLAAEVLRQGEPILAMRGEALAAALGVLQGWAFAHAELVEFLRPDGGALCCLRMRQDRFDESAIHRFYSALAGRDTRVAPGSWFGESDRVFRVGFGHLPADLFHEALERLADALSFSALPQPTNGHD